MRRGDPGERRLPTPRRPVEDHRVRLAGLDRGAQRGAGAEHVLLADKVAQLARAACAPRAARPRAGPACAAGRCRRCRTASPTRSVSPMEYALLAIWCFAVALAGGLVGLVLGQHPPARRAAALDLSRRGDRRQHRHQRRRGGHRVDRPHSRRARQLAPVPVDGPALDRGRAGRRLPVGSAAGRPAAVRDRGGAPLQRVSSCCESRRPSRRGRGREGLDIPAAVADRRS